MSGDRLSRSNSDGRIRFTPAVRRAVAAKFGNRCGYCGEALAQMHVDHMVPVARAHQHRGFDVHGLSNLMPACPSCNNYKMTFDVEGFRRELESQIERARKHCLNFRLAERFGLIKTVESKVTFHFERVEVPNG